VHSKPSLTPPLSRGGFPKMVDLLERYLRAPLPVIPAKGPVDLTQKGDSPVSLGDSLAWYSPRFASFCYVFFSLFEGILFERHSLGIKTTAPKAGIQCGFTINVWCDWIPAFAGMTLCSSFVERIFSLFSLQWNYWKSPAGRGSFALACNKCLI
jgi:hypothetical protein